MDRRLALGCVILLSITPSVLGCAPAYETKSPTVEVRKEYYGDIKFIDTYKNGEKTNRKTYDEKGHLESEQDYPTE